MSIWDILSGGQYSGLGNAADVAGRNAADWEKTLNQANQYINPYYQAGTGQLPGYQKNIMDMLNPKDFYNRMMQGYEMSPEAKFQMQQGQDAMKNAASASGTLGSGDFSKQMMDYSQNLASRDRQNYFDRIMGIFNQGLSGQQGLVGTGYGAGTQMGQNAMEAQRQRQQMLMQQAMAQAYQNQAQYGGLGNLLGGIGGLVGGPAGNFIGKLFG